MNNLEIIDKREDGSRSFIVYHDENDGGFVSAIEERGDIHLKRPRGKDLNGALSDYHQRLNINGITDAPKQRRK